MYIRWSFSNLWLYPGHPLIQAIRIGADFSGLGSFDLAVHRVVEVLGYKPVNMFSCDVNKDCPYKFYPDHVQGIKIERQLLVANSLDYFNLFYLDKNSTAFILLEKLRLPLDWYFYSYFLNNFSWMPGRMPPVWQFGQQPGRMPRKVKEAVGWTQERWLLSPVHRFLHFTWHTGVILWPGSVHQRSCQTLEGCCHDSYLMLIFWAGSFACMVFQISLSDVSAVCTTVACFRLFFRLN